MKKVLKIDDNGLFIEDVLLEAGAEIPKDCVETLCPEGLYCPKWNGKEWVEGATEADIQARLIPTKKNNATQYLIETDYVDRQWNEETALGIKHNRTEEEFNEILKKRQDARELLRQYKDII